MRIRSSGAASSAPDFPPVCGRWGSGAPSCRRYIFLRPKARSASIPKCMLSGSVLGAAVLLDGITRASRKNWAVRPRWWSQAVWQSMSSWLCRHPLTYDPEPLAEGTGSPLPAQCAAKHERHHEPRSDGELPPSPPGRQTPSQQRQQPPPPQPSLTAVPAGTMRPKRAEP